MSRIFLVDDHALVRDGLRAVLQAAGHDIVGEADHPDEAAHAIVRTAPEVVLLDLNLGGRSGLDTIDAVRSRGGRARFLVLSMSAQPRHVARALQLGVDGYLLKDSPSPELLKAVETVARGRRHLGPGIAELALEVLALPRESDRLASLSSREQQILMLVARGRSSAEVARELNLSPKTVDTYRSRLMQKLDVGDVPALVRLAIREGLIDVNDE
nr:response regulator transcription factor [uncultured Caldimonas sp.]